MLNYEINRHKLIDGFSFLTLCLKNTDCRFSEITQDAGNVISGSTNLIN